MNGQNELAEQFESYRPHLRAVAYRLLGRLDEADDAVQDTWLRCQKADFSLVENLGGWLTTTTARVCLNMLRTRIIRAEAPLGVLVPDPIVSRDDADDPEQAALLADAIGLALQVVLETLAPAERVAFVLHDIFALPFNEIAPLVGRSPMTTRQMASRARRRVQGVTPNPDGDRAQQRTLVTAFAAATREGDLVALLRVLDPDVVVHADWGATPGGASQQMRGADAVAKQAVVYARLVAFAKLALVNGAVGLVAAKDGRVLAVLGFTVRQGSISEIDILADSDRLRRLDLMNFDD
jgi:RNA polymerase sigma factor (sigma-70 family)